MARPDLSLAICNRQKLIPIDPDWYQQLAEHVLADQPFEQAEISLVFLPADEMRTLNQKHLQHDYVTDVLTFPLGDAAELLEGEIVVCPEFAEQQAVEYNMKLEHEVSLYVVHGLLHLLGYDDKNPADQRVMHAEQERLLQSFLASAGHREQLD